MRFLIIGIAMFSSITFADTFPFQTIDKATEAYKNREFQKSSKLFKSLEEDDPSVVYNLANAEYKSGRYSQALENYEKAKGIDEAIRQYNMANCYFKKGNLEEAIRRYRLSFKLREEDDTWYNLNLALLKKDEKKKQKKEDESKKKDKKKQDKKRREEEKKKEEKKEKQEQKEKEKQKKEDSKKDGKEKKSQEPRKSNENDANSAQKREKAKKNMKPEDKMRKKELSHLLKKLSKEKMPTMMYQTIEKKGGRDDKNPW